MASLAHALALNVVNATNVWKMVWPEQADGGCQRWLWQRVRSEERVTMIYSTLMFNLQPMLVNLSSEVFLHILVTVFKFHSYGVDLGRWCYAKYTIAPMFRWRQRCDVAISSWFCTLTIGFYEFVLLVLSLGTQFTWLSHRPNWPRVRGPKIVYST